MCVCVSLQSRRQGTSGIYVLNSQFFHEGWYECNAMTVDDVAHAAAFLTVRGELHVIHNKQLNSMS